MISPEDGTGDAPRPLPATYWVAPGRLLVGEYPGSRSRAEAMDRLRRVLAAGVSCFVDLTEPREVPPYDEWLPVYAPDGRRIEYRREPIPDHGVPASIDTMTRVVSQIDRALDAGHVVYVHCRAGIGRSATVAGCWLASHAAATGDDPLERLNDLWQQSARARTWPTVPETDEQAKFVEDWAAAHRRAAPAAVSVPGVAPSSVQDRLSGALLGLALGDASGEARRKGLRQAGDWTQHTALALCVAESLLELGRFDARDQIERFLRWRQLGHCSARGEPGQPTADVAHALATYQWRRQPMAGSHDPRDRSTASLSRVVSAVAFHATDPPAAVALAAECSRTTHQSPVVLDACRYLAALFAGALRGDGAARLLNGVYEPVPGLWARQPLKPEIVAAAGGSARLTPGEPPAGEGDVSRALRNARAAVADAATFTAAVETAIDSGRDPALDGALAGALAGALFGASALPAAAIAVLPRRAQLEGLAVRFGARSQALQPGVRGAGVDP